MAFGLSFYGFYHLRPHFFLYAIRQLPVFLDHVLKEPETQEVRLFLLPCLVLCEPMPHASVLGFSLLRCPAAAS